MRSIAHHNHRQKPERMKFLRIIFGCPEGARKWRILFFAMLLHSKTDALVQQLTDSYGNRLESSSCVTRAAAAFSSSSPPVSAALDAKVMGMGGVYLQRRALG